MIKDIIILLIAMFGLASCTDESSRNNPDVNFEGDWTVKATSTQDHRSFSVVKSLDGNYAIAFVQDNSKNHSLGICRDATITEKEDTHVLSCGLDDGASSSAPIPIQIARTGSMFCEKRRTDVTNKIIWSKSDCWWSSLGSKPCVCYQIGPDKNPPFLQDPGTGTGKPN